MKKITTTTLLILTLFINLSSCSKEDTSNSADLLLPKKIVSENGNGKKTTTNISYDGNKIVETISDDGSKTVFTYTGNLITKEHSFRNGDSGVIEEQYDYTYEKDNLKSFIYTHSGGHKSKGNYIYNSDGTINIEYYSINFDTGVETKSQYASLLIFNNDKLVKTVDSNDFYITTTILEWDTKNSPFKNILGFNKLKAISSYTNNIIKITQTKTYKTSQVQNTEVATYEYTYNTNGYPTSKKRTPKEEDFDEEYTAQYFYE